MGEWFSSLSREKKDFFLLAIVELFVFLCLIPLMFVGAGSWTIGWFVGSLITLLNYYLLVRFSASILNPDNANKMSATFIGIAASGLRFLLFAGLLILAGICTYRSQWLGGFSAFNVFAVALSYLPLPIVLVITRLFPAKKTEKEQSK